MRKTIASTALALFALLVATGASAQALTTHHLHFFIDPQVIGVTPLAEVASDLSELVADVNAVWSKNTIRRFVFDPAIDLTVTAIEPAFPQPIADRNDIWVIVRMSTTLDASGVARSGGGFAQPYMTGGFLGGGVWLTWGRIWDPRTLTGALENFDYLNGQLLALVHETEHIFGAGYGEYYSVNARDLTGVAPIVNLSVNDPTDEYWAAHVEWFRDPLTAFIVGNPRIGNPQDRAGFLAATRFVDATAAVVNTNWDPKPGAPSSIFLFNSLSNTQVHVVDELGRPIPLALVQAWRVSFDGTPTRVGIALTNPLGNASIDWFYAFDNMTSLTNKLLIKASAPGRLSEAAWLSTYDVIEQQAALGFSPVGKTVRLEPVDAVAPVAAFTAPASGAVLSMGDPITLTANATDNYSIRRVEFWADLSAVGLPLFKVCDVVTAPYTCEYIPPFFTGPISFEVRAYDRSGNVGSATVAATIKDVTPPLALDMTPAGGTWIHPGSVTFTSQFVDQGGIAYSEFRVNGARICQVQNPGQNITSSASCTWSAGKGPSYTVDAIAVDTSGNAGRRSIVLNVDSVAPVLSVLSPAEDAVVPAGSALTFAASAIDDVAVARVDFIVDQALICSVAAPPYECAWTAPATPGKDSRLIVRAVDIGGNVAEKGVSLLIR